MFVGAILHIPRTLTTPTTTLDTTSKITSIIRSRPDDQSLGHRR